MTTYTFTGAVAYDRLGSSWRTAAGLRSVSVTDPGTGLLPTNLVQGGVAVSWLTADVNSRYSFTCDVPGVVVDFGAGAEALYANEVPGLAIAAGGATTTAIDTHLGGDATNLVATVAGKLDGTAVDVKIAAQHTVDSSTYALLGGPHPRVGFIGNSITAGAGTLNNDAGIPGNLSFGNVLYGGGPGTYAMLASDGRWEYVSPAGVGGDKSDQILARLTRDIITPGCTICVLGEIFRNDIVAGYTTAASMANLAAMVTQLRAAGVQPVLATMTPDAVGGTQPLKTQTALLNRRILDFAARNGLPVIDWFAPLVNPATGELAAAYVGSGVHPNDLGSQLMGKAAAKVLDAICPPGSPLLIDHVAEGTTDLMGGIGLFLGTPSGAGVAGSWTNGLSAGGVATITTDSAVLGNMQTITQTAAAALSGVICGNSIGAFAVGDVLELSGIITSDGGVAAQVIMVFTGTGQPYTNVRTCNVKAPVTRGIFRHRFTVPTGTHAYTTPWTLTLYLNALAGTGVVSFGQVSVRNLTALGIV